AVSFTTLLQVNSKIRLSGEEIRYEGEPVCRFQLFSGEIAEKKQRYFHLRFTWDGDPDGPAEPLARFQSLLKAVRAAVSHGKGEVETLWNELSAHYACKAYPLIHEIENLMRRLIANFMLVTVGREWLDE